MFSALRSRPLWFGEGLQSPHVVTLGRMQRDELTSAVSLVSEAVDPVVLERRHGMSSEKQENKR